jgi:uncharacterized protein (DUF1501 family)
MHFNRREFLRRSIYSALGGVGLYSALGNLQLVSAAARDGMGKGAPGQYQALVCVFLFGGNDSCNTIVPYSAPHYGIYQATRPAVALSQASIAALALAPQPIAPGLPGGPPSDGASYGLHPSMPELRGLFNSQRAAVIGNVGTLLGPITQAQYQNGTHAAPPQLFSHDDQSNFWQTSRPDDVNANGWGGRIADLLHAGNSNQQLPMTISISGQNLFQRGATVDQYVMSSAGVPPIEYLEIYQNELGVEAFNALMAQGTQPHMFERGYANAMRRSIATYEMVNTALNAATPLATVFPNRNLGNQLRMVANMINVRAALGMQKQVFYVGLGGFDTHNDQLATQANILTDLSQSLKAFYDATVEMGLSESVTTFTASDFGRTLSTNSDGTDHGWGGHHFVVGGAVRGGRFFGAMNSLAQNGNPNDAGYGQIIPTTSVDQYAATLASWFGVGAGGIADIFPTLPQYATPNLGFMA